VLFRLIPFALQKSGKQLLNKLKKTLKDEKINVVQLISIDSILIWFTIQKALMAMQGIVNQTAGHSIQEYCRKRQM
jgi:hypothetical protein